MSPVTVMGCPDIASAGRYDVIGTFPLVRDLPHTLRPHAVELDPSYLVEGGKPSCICIKYT